MGSASNHSHSHDPAVRGADSGPGDLPAAVGIVALVALAFGAALRNEFIWDDEILILGNPLVQSWDQLPRLLTSSFWADSTKFYRPVVGLLYVFDYTAWGSGNPTGFHATNLVLHSFFSVVLYALLRRRFGLLASFLAAALFAVHPVHVAAVAPAYARDNMLPGMLAAALLALDSARHWKPAAWICLAVFALTCLSKESGLVFPLLAGAYSFLYFEAEERRDTRWLQVWLWCLAAAYLAARVLWMPFYGPSPLAVIADQGLLVRVWTFLEVLTHYAQLLIFPRHLFAERHFVTDSVTALRPWLGLVVSLAVLAYGWRVRQRKPHLLFGALWFYLALGPTSNLVALQLTMAEQWLYPAAMGIAWMLAGMLTPALDGAPGNAVRRRWGVAALSVVILAFAARSALRTLDWHDGATLFSKDLVHAPNSFVLHNNLGLAHWRRGDREAAEEEFRAALSLYQRYGIASNNLGMALEARQDLEGAEKRYRDAIEYNRENLAYLNLARVLWNTDRREEAVFVLTLGRRAHPAMDELAQMEALMRAELQAQPKPTAEPP
jgi:tetratricopeptide (TPR) repeat protein